MAAASAWRCIRPARTPPLLHPSHAVRVADEQSYYQPGMPHQVGARCLDALLPRLCTVLALLPHLGLSSCFLTHHITWIGLLPDEQILRPSRVVATAPGREDEVPAWARLGPSGASLNPASLCFSQQISLDQLLNSSRLPFSFLLLALNYQRCPNPG